VSVQLLYVETAEPESPRRDQFVISISQCPNMPMTGTCKQVKPHETRPYPHHQPHPARTPTQSPPASSLPPRPPVRSGPGPPRPLRPRPPRPLRPRPPVRSGPVRLGPVRARDRRLPARPPARPRPASQSPPSSGQVPAPVPRGPSLTRRRASSPHRSPFPRKIRVRRKKTGQKRPVFLRGARSFREVWPVGWGVWGGWGAGWAGGPKRLGWVWRGKRGRWWWLVRTAPSLGPRETCAHACVSRVRAAAV
jgi:hypothetical protein